MGWVRPVVFSGSNFAHFPTPGEVRLEQVCRWLLLSQLGGVLLGLVSTAKQPPPRLAIIEPKMSVGPRMRNRELDNVKIVCKPSNVRVFT